MSLSRYHSLVWVKKIRGAAGVGKYFKKVPPPLPELLHHSSSITVLPRLTLIPTQVLPVLFSSSLFVLDLMWFSGIVSWDWILALKFLYHVSYLIIPLWLGCVVPLYTHMHPISNCTPNVRLYALETYSSTMMCYLVSIAIWFVGTSLCV